MSDEKNEQLESNEESAEIKEKSSKDNAQEVRADEIIEETATDDENAEASSSFAASVFEWVQPLIVALVVVTLLLTFVFRQATVKGNSMNDTLKNQDRLIITNFFYEPQVGDIVVISHGEEYSTPLIKRVIATEGQTLSINFETGDVVVDGVLLDEPYIVGKTMQYTKSPLEVPEVVPEGYVYVMGDNRQNSLDSRSTEVGLIEKKNIVGKAQFRIFPFSSFGSIY